MLVFLTKRKGMLAQAFLCPVPLLLHHLYYIMQTHVLRIFEMDRRSFKSTASLGSSRCLQQACCSSPPFLSARVVGPSEMPASKPKPSEIAAEAKKIYIPYVRQNFGAQWPATSFLCYSETLVAQPPAMKLPIRFGPYTSTFHLSAHYLRRLQRFTIVTQLMWLLIGLREKMSQSL
jgi:hypothetical protein